MIEDQRHRSSGKPAMRSSVALFDALAATYDAHFEVPHRRAYDDLAWEFVEPLLPNTPGRVIDAGCGIGRWAHRLIHLGHYVTGIEPSPAMAAAARAQLPSDRFTVLEGSMEEAKLPDGEADLVLALGSLQFTHDPAGTIDRLAQWARVGGSVVILVDSLIALVLELIALGRHAEAFCRLETRQGTWSHGGQCADLHLLDREWLERAMQGAGLTAIRTRGLLVGASALGRERLLDRLTSDWERQMAVERQLAEHPLVADLGKQLLASGCRGI